MQETIHPTSRSIVLMILRQACEQVTDEHGNLKRQKKVALAQNTIIEQCAAYALDEQEILSILHNLVQNYELRTYTTDSGTVMYQLFDLYSTHMAPEPGFNVWDQRASYQKLIKQAFQKKGLVTKKFIISYCLSNAEYYNVCPNLNLLEQIIESLIITGYISEFMINGNVYYELTYILIIDFEQKIRESSVYTITESQIRQELSELKMTDRSIDNFLFIFTQLEDIKRKKDLLGRYFYTYNSSQNEML